MNLPAQVEAEKEKKEHKRRSSKRSGHSKDDEGSAPTSTSNTSANTTPEIERKASKIQLEIVSTRMNTGPDLSIVPTITEDLTSQESLDGKPNLSPITSLLNSASITPSESASLIPTQKPILHNLSSSDLTESSSGGSLTDPKRVNDQTLNSNLKRQMHEVNRLKKKHEKERNQLKLNSEAIVATQKSKMASQLFSLLESKGKSIVGEEYMEYKRKKREAKENCNRLLLALVRVQKRAEIVGVFFFKKT